MNRTHLPLAALFVVCALTTATAQQSQREISWVNTEIAKIQGLEHKVLQSRSLGHPVGYVVWTPPGYSESEPTRYPVVYFLHGAGGTEASDSGGFSSMVAGAIRAGKFPKTICVFPNGGMSGYRGEVEAMIIDELVPRIDRDYRTKAEASGRALAGFSMGGAGSVRLAIHHPTLFCAAGSWGGALSWRGRGEDSPLLPAANAKAEALKSNGFALLTINGDEDRPEGFTPLKEVLESAGISHEAITLEETRHNLGHYYERSGNAMLAFLADRLGDHKEGLASNRSVRVLTIGNSFAQNACKYLKVIAADGGVGLTIGTANLGGCTLERHAKLARESHSDPTHRPYTRVSGADRIKVSLQEYLAAEEWDFVTLQQMSALSFRPETYHPHVEELVALVREHAPQAQILFHQTWAYRPDAPLLKEWNMTQEEMYNGIVDAYGGVAKQFGARLIPVGDAFHRVRTAETREVIVPDPGFDYGRPEYPALPDQENSLVVGWYWKRDDLAQKPQMRLDFKHANAAGCYLAGLVWYESLTGNDAQEIRYVPKGVSVDEAAYLRGAAHAVAQAGPATVAK